MLARPFLVYFLPTAILLTAVTVFLAWSEHQHRATILESSEKAELDVLAGLIVGDLKAAAADVLFLADQPAQQRLLEHGERRDQGPGPAECRRAAAKLGRSVGDCGWVPTGSA